MKSLRNLRKIIKEQIDATEYKAIVEIHYDSERTVTSVLDHIRSLCGVVIVNSRSVNRLTDMKESVITKIKFYSNSIDPKLFLSKMTDNALSIEGVYAFRVKRVQKTNKEA